MTALTPIRIVRVNTAIKNGIRKTTGDSRILMALTTLLLRRDMINLLDDGA